MGRTARDEGALVVVADGDDAAGELLAQYFARRGFRVSRTSLGQDVIGLARAGRLGVAIVDVVLGDMSGHSLVARLKTIDPELHVLMTTADYRPEFEVRARQIGILHYAQKPADFGRLEAVVSKAMGVVRSAWARVGTSTGAATGAAATLPGAAAGSGRRSRAGRSASVTSSRAPSA